MHIADFTREDYPEYKSWFLDDTLNAELGPLDDEWLEHVLSDRDGRQLTLKRGGELVGVIGVHLPKPGHPYFYVTDAAIRPDLKSQGIGRKLFAAAMALPEFAEPRLWKCVVDIDNTATQIFMKKLGWTSDGHPRGDNDMIEWRFERT